MWLSVQIVAIMRRVITSVDATDVTRRVEPKVGGAPREPKDDLPAARQWLGFGGTKQPEAPLHPRSRQTITTVISSNVSVFIIFVHTICKPTQQSKTGSSSTGSAPKQTYDKVPNSRVADCSMLLLHLARAITQRNGRACLIFSPHFYRGQSLVRNIHLCLLLSGH